MNWRKLEADMIREYFFELLEKEKRKRYERARNAADRAADRY